MSAFFSFLETINTILIIGLIVFVFLAFIFISQTNSKLNRLKKRYDKLLRGRGDLKLEELLASHSSDIEKAQEEARVLEERISSKEESLDSRIGAIEEAMTKSLQNIGMHKYNAFEYSVGQRSFSLALLNQDLDGVIITSIHGEEASHIYSKEVKKGKAQEDLSIEEEIALGRALN